MYAFARPFLLAPDEPPAGGAPATPPEAGTPPPAAAAGGTPAPAEPPAAGEAPWEPPTREAWEAQQTAIATANRRLRDLERAQTDAQRQAAEEAGNFEELHKTAQERADKLEAGIRKSAVDAATVAAAQRLGFRNPTLAVKLVSTDGVEAVLDDEAFTASVAADGNAVLERRLTELLTQNPELKGDPARPQLPGAGDSPPASAGGGHSALNDAIRRSAGRA